MKTINLSKGSHGTVSNSNSRANVKLKWQTAIDFDLHAIVKKGNNVEEVYFRNKGRLDSFPFVKLDQDAGVGSTAGDNEENLTIEKLSNVDEITFFIDVFGRDREDFEKYKPTLTIQFMDETFKVDFSNQKSRGKYFVLAQVYGNKIVNVNKAVMEKPTAYTIYNAENETSSNDEVGFAEVKNTVVGKIKGFFGL